MDYTGFRNLCIPVLVCNEMGVLLYKNDLFYKRLSFLRMGANIKKHVVAEDRLAFKQTLESGSPSILLFAHKNAIGGRGLAMQLDKGLVLIAFFAELQPFLLDALREKFLKSVPDLQEFFRALTLDYSDDPNTQAEKRLFAAEAKSGALTALMLNNDLSIGHTRFHVLSLFEELFVGLRADLKHCGAQIMFHNKITLSTYRYSSSCLLPLSLVKLMLFALLTTKDKRIEVTLQEGADHQPYFETRFRSSRKLPIMREVDNFRVFAARFPHLYPMLFGYLPALIEDGCRIALSVGEDGVNVTLRVHLHCEPNPALILNTPENEEETLRVLRALLRYSTAVLA